MSSKTIDEKLTEISNTVTAQTDKADELVSEIRNSWQEVKAVHEVTNHNQQAMRDWQTQTGETTFKDLAGNTHQVPTLKSLIADAQSINPNPHVMTKAQFDALREMRKQQYAGSGFVEWGKHNFGNPNVNEGMWQWLNPSFRNRFVLGEDASNRHHGVSKTIHPQVLVDGTLHQVYGVVHHGTQSTLIFPPAPDGTKTYDSATGTVTQHSNAEVAFATETETNKVITSRKDLVFLESWHEKIADKDVVYPLGNVQYGASGYKGIGLLNNLVEQGYSAFGEWDQNTKGYGAKWSTLTDAQKAIFLGEPEHNIYYDPKAKAYVQVRYRVRVVEGFGNSWNSAHPSKIEGAEWATYSSKRIVYAQGSSNSKTNKVFVSNVHLQSTITKNDNGVAEGESSTFGLLSFGETKPLALPIALVQRLNQGAYHPSYNPMGCRAWNQQDNGGAAPWYSTEAGNINAINQAFDIQFGGVGRVGAHSNTGGVSTGQSGRSDQYKYHDAIYAGQVEDLRLNANKLDVNQLREETMRKAVAGTLRGKEKVPFTKVKTGFCHHSISTIYVYQRNYVTPSSLIDKDILYDATRYLDSYPTDSTVSCSPIAIKFIDAGDTDLTTFSGGVALNTWLIVDKLRIANNSQHLAMINQNTGNYLWFSEGSASTIKAEIIFPTEAQSAEFDSLPWVDIIGSPENIAATFPDGVVGQWVPQLPSDDTEQQFKANRKCLSHPAVNALRTMDNGETWQAITASVSSVENEIQDTWNAQSVGLVQYESLSHFTKPANNSQIVGSLGDVYASQAYLNEYGNRLHSSLTGRTGIRIGGPLFQEFLGLSKYTYYSPRSTLGWTAQIGDEPTHCALNLDVTNAYSPAYKTLHSITEKNGLLYLQFHGAELKHNGTDWGDDQTIPIIDGENVKTDLNGNTVKVFCHHTQLPIGIASH
ncbi:hypothetical protein ACSLBF_04945 [Pseudoalteromonas sp. T1lg65]|uniref:hypothetical protein n=1 Tax=Pseudoalteromonas sp. T1lg65 TaxID=2077101 RepID=UPI003F7A749E